MIAENSMLRGDASGQIYQQSTNQTAMYGQAASPGKRFDLEPTKGVLDHGSVKRPRNKIASENLSGVAAHGEDEEEDDSNEDVAEIGTHRKESLHGSQNDLNTVNRFNSHTKN